MIPTISRNFAALATLGLPLTTIGAPTTKKTEEPPAPTPTLEEIVVTATRTEIDPNRAPNAVRTVSAEEISERQARTLPEALREVPGVSVQKTSNGQGSPFVRGFTGFRTLGLIDGVRLNNSTFRDGPNQYWGTIDQLSLDHLELIPGQGSVQYGSDAIGGTLNVFTKGSGFRNAAAGQTFFNGGAGYRYSSAERSHAEHVEFNFGQGQSWGLHLGGTLRQFGDIQAADLGRQHKTGYDEWAYDLRFDAALNEQWSLTAVHQQLRQDDVWRTHSTIYGVPWKGTEIGSDLRRSFDQDRTLSYIRLSGQELDSGIDSASLTVSYQTSGETQSRVKSSGSSEISDVDVGTFGVDLQLTSKTPFGILTYGVDYYRDNVDSSSASYKAGGGLDKRGIQGPVGDDSSYDLFGLYLQDQIDAGEALHFFLGVRYTHAEANVGRYQNPLTGKEDSASGNWDNAVGSLRVVYDLDDADQYAIYGGVSQGFRAPNLSDLSRLDIARSGELEVASTELDPEKYLNFEIGLKAETENFVGGVSYFYTLIDDLIVRRPTGATVGADALAAVSKANGGEGHMQGVELAGRYIINPNWSIFGHATWTEGEADQFPGKSSKTAREPLSRVVPFMGRAGVRWQTSDSHLWIEASCLAASKANRLNTADRGDTQRIPPGGTPGYTLVSLRGGYRFNDHVELTLGLENILDQAYRSHGSGSNEPGFGVTTGLNVKF